MECNTDEEGVGCGGVCFEREGEGTLTPALSQREREEDESRGIWMAVKVGRVWADGAGMEMLRETELIAVGLGLAAFLLAMSRIVTAEAKRSLDVHFVQAEAMELRNAYAESILALRPEVIEVDEEPIEVSPVGEGMEQAA